MKPYLSLLSALFLLSACLAVKPGAVKGGKNLFETFYVGEDGTQYFIKPLHFYSQDNQEKALVDFTFRYKDQIKDSVVVNFSLQSSQVYKSIESFSLSNSTFTTTSTELKLLFNEKRKQGILSRFSTTIPLSDLNQLFQQNTWSLQLTFTAQNQKKYQVSQKSAKKISKIKNNVFVLM